MNRVLTELEMTRENPEAFAARDAEFHRRLAATTRNALLVVLLDSIRDLLQEVRLRVHGYPDLPGQVIPGHRKILERLIAKDPAGARQAMREHLERARHIQRAVLTESDNIDRDDQSHLNSTQDYSEKSAAAAA